MFDDFEHLKLKISILDVAELLNINLSSNNTSKCPFADHPEKTGSFKIYPKSGSFYCFGCSRGGDIITLAKLLLGLSSNKEAGIYLSRNFGLGLFEKKLTPKRKKELEEEFKNREKCRFNIELLHTWKNESENSLILMYRTLRDISKHSKRPEDFGSELYAFAQAELFRGEIEDILDFLRCGTNQEIINNYSYIKWYIKDLENRWDKTQKMINGGQKIEL